MTEDNRPLYVVSNWGHSQAERLEVVEGTKAYTFWNKLAEGYTLADVPERDRWLVDEWFHRIESTGDDKFDLAKVRDMVQEYTKRRERTKKTSIITPDYIDIVPIVKVQRRFLSVPVEVKL